MTDVARANVFAVAAGLRGFRGYNVASGRVTTVGALAAALVEAMNGPAPVSPGASAPATCGT